MMIPSCYGTHEGGFRGRHTMCIIVLYSKVASIDGPCRTYEDSTTHNHSSAECKYLLA